MPPPGNFDDVAADGNTTCALAGGVATCWGQNDSGQAKPPGDTLFSSISVRRKNACGLKQDGTVVCWGTPPAGEPPPPADVFTAISANSAYVCGLKKTDQSILCWGNAIATPIPTGPFTQISAGLGLACGLRPNGRVECWGTWQVPPQD
jgi:hypothetical protein